MTAETNGDGRDKRHCGAKKRQGQGTCTRPAGWGTDHAGWGRCKLHGGSTQSLKTVAKREAAEDAVATYGLPRDIDPHDALLEEVHRTAGHVQWLGGIVAAIESGDLAWGVTREKHGGDDHGTTLEAEVNTYLRLYQAERAHLVKVAKTCIDAGIDERRVRLAEQQGEVIVQVIRATLDDLGVTVDGEVAETVGRHLRAVPA